MRERQFSKKISLSLISVTAVLLAWGCGDSTDEQIRAAELAQSCTINSDCKGDLVCIFERCHIACEDDEDCEADLRCVSGGSDGVNVCQLEDETDCRIDKDCPGEQVCGVDQECRDSCTDDDECVKGQICAASHECASTLPNKDELDSENNIVPDGATPNGQGGAGGGAPATSNGGHGGATGPGEEAGGPGRTAEGGAAGQGPSGTAGQGPSGAAGDTASGGAPGTGELVETPDGVETVPNGDRLHPVPLSASAVIYLASTDEDWFSVQAPDDGRAHVLHLTLQQEDGMRTSIFAEAASDFALIGDGTTDAGETTNVYVSVGPGTTTLLKFMAWGGGAVWRRLDLTLDMTAENDEHEPNNSIEAATQIDLNTDVTAQMINGFSSSNGQVDDGDSVDWYEVELAAGTATLNLSSTVSGGRFEIHRVKNGVRTSIRTPLEGEFDAWPFPVAEAGIYHLRIAPHSAFLPFIMGPKPGNMSDNYTFQVQQ
jgi:hypothetical protein